MQAKRRGARRRRYTAWETGIILMAEPFGQRRRADPPPSMVWARNLRLLLSRTGKGTSCRTHSLCWRGRSSSRSRRGVVFSARPAHNKERVKIDEPHPRSRVFMTPRSSLTCATRC